MTIFYQQERDLSPAEFNSLLSRSALAERRPVNDPPRIQKMLQHADLILMARVNGLRVGVSRARQFLTPTSLIPLILLMPAVLSLCSQTTLADDGAQTVQQLSTTVKVEMGYLLSLPEDYDTQEKWPLLLFLHGSGERGADLELVKMHGPPKLIAGGKKFPFIVVSPQCAKGRGWEPIELSALLDELEHSYKVDSDRIYVTGLSMGGFATWELAGFSPDRFAAIAPICGGGEPYWTRRYTHLPTWAFHGAKDQGVPVERTQEMIDAMIRNGGTPKLTIYPEAEHDSWTETYNNPEFYAWLLGQKRTAPEAK